LPSRHASLLHSCFERGFSALWSPRAKSWTIKKFRYTEGQIAFALIEAKVGAPVAEVIWRMGFSKRTSSAWRRFMAWPA
jgi:hypothetical protein